MTFTLGGKRTDGNQTGVKLADGGRRRWRWALSAYGLVALLVNLVATMPVAAEPIRLLAFGDSLTAGYGLAAEDSFPNRLEKALRQRGYDVDVINAGVSGDTSAGGVARLDWVLSDRPQAAVVEFGANDGLRGLDPEQTYRNLEAIVTRLRGEGVRVLVAGMRAPPNLGREYQAAFDAVHDRLRSRHDILFYPFFLEGVAAVPALNQPDGIHPNARGVRIIVDSILPMVEALLGPAG